jgi:hypothetical protein
MYKFKDFNCKIQDLHVITEEFYLYYWIYIIAIQTKYCTCVSLHLGITNYRFLNVLNTK